MGIKIEEQSSTVSWVRCDRLGIRVIFQMEYGESNVSDERNGLSQHEL